MKKVLLLCTLAYLLTLRSLLAQGVGINIDNSNPDASALLDIKSSDKGVLVPRMTQAERNAIILPATGLLLYQTDAISGFYYYNGIDWVSTGWGLAGNNNTNPATNFIGNTDDVPFSIRVNNIRAGLISNSSTGFNTAFGYSALNAVVGNRYNTAFGHESMLSTTTGAFNTVMGYQALQNNTIGRNNVAIGYQSAHTNVAGSAIVAIGTEAMQYANNQPIGFSANNIAIGYRALRGSIIPADNDGRSNIAIGVESLTNNTIGVSNIGIGSGTLRNNTSGGSNIGIGSSTLFANNTGNFNTAIGMTALRANTTGIQNVAIGYATLESGANHTNVTAVGTNIDLTTNRNNVSLFGSNISNGQCTNDNQVLLGNTAITEIRAQVGSITTYSDARIKTDVIENVKGLDFITRLKPVTYYTNPTVLHRIWGTPDSLLRNIDHSQIKQTRQMGFLAQEVEKAASEAGFSFTGIDVPKDANQVYTLRYGDFVMPLVQAVKELNTENKLLKAELSELKKSVEEIKEALQLQSAKKNK